MKMQSAKILATNTKFYYFYLTYAMKKIQNKFPNASEELSDYFATNKSRDTFYLALLLVTDKKQGTFLTDVAILTEAELLSKIRNYLHVDQTHSKL